MPGEPHDQIRIDTVLQTGRVQHRLGDHHVERRSIWVRVRIGLWPRRGRVGIDRGLKPGRRMCLSALQRVLILTARLYGQDQATREGEERQPGAPHKSETLREGRLRKSRNGLESA